MPLAHHAGAVAPLGQVGGEGRVGGGQAANIVGEEDTGVDAGGDGVEAGQDGGSGRGTDRGGGVEVGEAQGGAEEAVTAGSL